MALFIDTWGWLTLEDGKDAKHELTSRLYEQRRGKPGGIVTSDFVLDETITHLFRHRQFEEAWKFLEGVLQSAEAGYIAIQKVDEARFQRAVEMRRRFRDKPRISFTDLTSMAIMREMRITDVLTADRHFEQVGLGFRTWPERGRL